MMMFRRQCAFEPFVQLIALLLRRNPPHCSELRRLRGNPMQCIAIQCIAMQSNAIQCNPMQSNAIQYNAMQCSAMQYNTMLEYEAMQCKPV